MIGRSFSGRSRKGPHLPGKMLERVLDLKDGKCKIKTNLNRRKERRLKRKLGRKLVKKKLQSNVPLGSQKIETLPQKKGPGKLAIKRSAEDIKRGAEDIKRSAKDIRRSAEDIKKFQRSENTESLQHLPKARLTKEQQELLRIEEENLSNYAKKLGIPTNGGIDMFREDGIEDIYMDLLRIESKMNIKDDHADEYSDNHADEHSDNHADEHSDNHSDENSDDHVEDQPNEPISNHNDDQENENGSCNGEITIKNDSDIKIHPLENEVNNIELKKSINRILNKLTPRTIEESVALIDALLSSNSRYETVTLLDECIMNFISSDMILSDIFIGSYSAVVAVLYTFFGADVVTGIISSVVSKLSSQESYKVINIGDTTSKKSLNNVTFLALLYNFHVISSSLLYDIICFPDELNETTMEIILKIVKLSGYELRDNDPMRFKQIMVYVQEKYNKQNNSELGSKFKFLFNSLNDIKNCKKSSFARGESPVNDISKTINFIFKKRKIPQAQCLRHNMKDILSSEGKGRWWLADSKWVHHENVLSGSAEFGTEKIKNLAKMQNMNTDIRRSIFTALVSGRDFLDAFEKIMKLGLKEKQEREILRVVVHCSLQESSFNPYYALVAQKLCAQKLSFRTTAKYILWDYIKQMDMEDDSESGALEVAKVNKLAKMYAFMYSSGNVSLGILSAFDFSSLSFKQSLFLKIMFYTLLGTFLKTPENVGAFIMKIRHKATSEQLAVFFKSWQKRKYSIPGISEQEIAKFFSKGDMALESLMCYK